VLVKQDLPAEVASVLQPWRPMERRASLRRETLGKWGTLAVLPVGIATILFFACGRPPGEVTLASDSAGAVEVNGVAGFGSQCPYGTFSRPNSAKLNLWDCNIGRSSVELVEPLRALIFQADCKKKLITVRTLDGKLDTTWEVMPNGSFFFSIDGGTAKFRDDGAGNANCASSMSTDVFGKIDCANRDKVVINFESVWWLGKPYTPPPTAPGPGVSPAASASPGMPVPIATPSAAPIAGPGHPTPTPTSIRPSPVPTRHVLSFELQDAVRETGVECKLPKGCYFYSSAVVRQCE